jgi:hypothetical protein
VPAATPQPRQPSSLVLGSVEDLLEQPGCAVCRHAAEASDRYLAWFALESHADPVIITRLCASLGMCPGHTRAVMRQPGAPIRLTAVYGYLVQAARACLRSRPAPLAACPACEHDRAAADRAMGIILDGLSEIRLQERHPGLAGLCLPHLRAAAAQERRRGHRRLLLALAVGAAGATPSMEVLAGGPDHDADERARLRALLPSATGIPAGLCLACLAAARAEARQLARRAGDGGGQHGDGGHVTCLCAAHLRDAAAIRPDLAPAMLATQSGFAADAASRLLSARPRLGSRRFRGGRAWRRALPGAEACSACAARESAASQAMQRCQVLLRAAPASAAAACLCVRHVLTMRAASPAAGAVASAAATVVADALIEELAEAFRKNTWANRREPRGPEMTAWQRAAAFLDGRVFGGGPAPGR